MKNVIGYGSLISKESLSKTIPIRDYSYVWITGYRRIFNLRTRLLKMYKIGENDERIAVLNVEPEEAGRVNAVIFSASDEELEKLKIRERRYYTKDVEVTDYFTGKSLGRAILFIGKKFAHGERIVSEDYLPVKEYLDKCREACYAVSVQFGKDFDETTFTAKGVRIDQYLGV